MINLKNILNELRLNVINKRTDPMRKSRAESINAHLSTVIRKQTAKGGVMRFLCKAQSQSKSGTSYDINFRTPTTMPITEDNWKRIGQGNMSIYANCTCPDFKYRWETVLWKRNSARRVESNGRMPDITNPEYKLSFCKHITASWPIVKEYIKKKDLGKLKWRKRK